MPFPRWIRIGIPSLFLAIHLGVVLLSNFSPEWPTGWSRGVEAVLLRYAAWSGLNTRWEMFSNARGDDWRFLIEATCLEGKFRLPVAGQVERSFWQRNFFDFKEAKLRCNIALDSGSRQAYLRYLCRRYTCPSGKSIQRVQIEMQFRAILPMEEARKRGHHLSPLSRRQLLEEISCGIS